MSCIIWYFLQEDILHSCFVKNVFIAKSKINFPSFPLMKCAYLKQLTVLLISEYCIGISKGYILLMYLYYYFSGRFDLHLFTYSCSGCDQQFSPLTLEKIINEGYWPGGPKNFNYVFCENVFRVWDSLHKYMPGTF